jgi:hypothetical protein
MVFRVGSGLDGWTNKGIITYITYKARNQTSCCCETLDGTGKCHTVGHVMIPTCFQRTNVLD